MRLEHFDHQELLALVGLLKLVVRADGRLSDDELDALEQFGQEAGTDAWLAAVDAAERAFPNRETVLRHAAALQRAEVRTEIVQRLRAVAGTDGLTDAEAAVVAQVADLWGVV